jgi:hypothetical protein
MARLARSCEVGGASSPLVGGAGGLVRISASYGLLEEAPPPLAPTLPGGTGHTARCRVLAHSRGAAPPRGLRPCSAWPGTPQGARGLRSGAQKRRGNGQGRSVSGDPWSGVGVRSVYCQRRLPCSYVDWDGCANASRRWGLWAASAVKPGRLAATFVLASRPMAGMTVARLEMARVGTGGSEAQRIEARSVSPRGRRGRSRRALEGRPRAAPRALRRAGGGSVPR